MISLPVLSTTSPSLSELMRSCMLRAGLSHCPDLRPLVLGNPKAWLGTAYHRVLERLPEAAAARVQAPALLETFWNDEIARLQRDVDSHALNHRFGQASFWHGYYLVLETLRLRGAEMMPAPGLGSASPVGGGPQQFREETFSAFSGKLKGKPDLGCGDEIIDFKTGNIYETADLESPPGLKQAYVRQLRIYAYLVHEARGRWVRRGLLYPIAGPPVEVDIDPAICTQEAQEAVALLDQYNDAAAHTIDPATLASPSPEACRWCPYKALCPAFWPAAQEDWAGTLGGEAAAGRLESPVRSVYGGTAYALSVAVDAGTVPRQQLALSPLPILVHGTTATLSANDRVRIVGFGRRDNGTFYPSLRTVVMAEAAIPAIQSVGSTGS